MFYTSVVRPLLFSVPADTIHEIATKTGEVVGKMPFSSQIIAPFFNYNNSMLESTVFGTTFENPTGIGGGFDKDCRLIQLAPALGFGFWEVGSITARAYKGNKSPWNFRLPKEKAIIVNYGLRNKGAKVLQQKIISQNRRIPLIVNIAKTNNPNIKGKESIEDFNEAFVKMQPVADIVNINISCPNVGDGQLFCENPEMLNNLLLRIAKNAIVKPIVLKLKPDLDDILLSEILAVATSFKFVKGFIVSNLTKDRSTLKFSKQLNIARYAGGISGKPLQQKANNMLGKVYKKTNSNYPIIGLGGVFSAEDAYEKICLGASLVELVTGLIYQGPSVVKKINKGLVQLLEKDGFTNIKQAVGSKVV